MKSDNVKSGMQQAPHRSLFNALGFTEEEMKKPMVGIVSSYNEIVPEPAQEAPPDFAAVRRLLDNSFRTIYDTLTREEKRTLWRSVIKEIRIDNDQNITGVVFG
jgi:hypothetical protein